MATTPTTEVHTPEEAARRLGISVGMIIELLKARGYPFTEFSPDLKPWGKGGRGGRKWGLTDAQIETIIAGQARSMPGRDTAPVEAKPARGIPGHDGIDRLSRRPRAGRA
jgi:hypothetical protein